MRPPPRSCALAGYLGVSELAGPAVRALLRSRARRGKEDPDRLGERMGRAGLARPPGPLVWLHGASVGEGRAARTVAGLLRAEAPEPPTVLLTTGTLTAARALAPTLEPGVLHQHAPLDVAPWLRRFLDHWRPDVAARVDTELWPATLALTARRGAALAMVGARISAASARRWRRAPGLARAMLGRMAWIEAQDADSAARLTALGADPARVAVGGSLKAAAPPPPADPDALAGLRAAWRGRPVWAALSTHEGEEAAALAAARRGPPRLLTLIAPRHPERGVAVAAAARAAGFTTARRGAGEGPDGADVYVADTVGEMGLWLRLAPCAFIGGSLVPQGGHNPFEPASLGVLILHGPHVEAFADAYAALAAANAARPARDAEALGAALASVLGPDGALAPAAAAAARAGAAALARDDGPARRAAAALARLTAARLTAARLTAARAAR